LRFSNVTSRSTSLILSLIFGSFFLHNQSQKRQNPPKSGYFVHFQAISGRKFEFRALPLLKNHRQVAAAVDGALGERDGEGAREPRGEAHLLRGGGAGALPVVGWEWYESIREVRAVILVVKWLEMEQY
jgi:hypothetical protein